MLIKKYNVYLILFCIIINSKNITAQKCGYDAYMTEISKNPQKLEALQLEEDFLQNTIHQIKLRRQQKINTNPGFCTEDEDHTFEIPVVVHIVKQDTVSIDNDNPSEETIKNVINGLSRQYRGLDEANPIDLGVEFTLAKITPDGAPTNGIVRIASPTDLPYGQVKELSNWPKRDYVNIYIVNSISDSTVGLSTGSEIYIKGSRFTDNSTLSHEIGHHFNLRHTFQGSTADDCPPESNSYSDGDFCEDTEPHKDDFYNGEGKINECTGSIYGLNTARNIMSYYNNVTLYTLDQRDRVRASIMNNNFLKKSKGKYTPDPNFNLPPVVCQVTSSTTSNINGIGKVKIGMDYYASSFPKNDGGGIDLSNTASNYFEIDARNTNNIEITLLGARNSHQLGVWIDWNIDGDFEDENEAQFYKNGVTTALNTIPITLPTTIPYNRFVRLRILNGNDKRRPNTISINSPCSNPSEANGQTEEYLLYIKPEIPISDFTISSTAITTDSEIQFTDQSISETNIESSWAFTPNTVTYLDGTSESSQNPKVQFNEETNYMASLTVKNNAGCSVEKTMDITVSKGSLSSEYFTTETRNNVSSIVIYPSPAINELFISNPQELRMINMKIYDATGRTIQTYEFKDKSIKKGIDISRLNAGPFIIKISLENGYILKKMIKK